MQDAIDAAHRRAVEAGDDTYVDPVTGFDVFTAAYLADRGTCCGTGCRHCPYGDSATGAGADGARRPAQRRR